jgi:hypothetical protein
VNISEAIQVSRLGSSEAALLPTSYARVVEEARDLLRRAGVDASELASDRCGGSCDRSAF